MSPLSRRELLVGSSLLATGGLAGAAEGAVQQAGERQLKVLVAGAHPDDPESGCAGTIARYTDQGHAVTVLYLTRGEAGIAGKSHAQAAEIRTAEAEKACAILKARPIFAGQVDGATEIAAVRYDAFHGIVAAEMPDVVFTHWPIDSHRDHRVCSLLAYEAWLRSGRSFALYYFEVDLGAQTQCFRPTHYVDITTTEPRKRAACLAHESQNAAEGFYAVYHEKMHQFRGMEAGCKLAEAFVHHDQSPAGKLPVD
jgi:LmbE family N-acetylglucosaminyl deacetylase